MSGIIRFVELKRRLFHKRFKRIKVCKKTRHYSNNNDEEQ